MKWLYSIICIYIFTLCTFTCQDGDETCCEHKCTEHSSPQKQSHDENNSHTCSPFCFCNCCQGTTLVAVNTILEAVDTPKEIYVSALKEIHIKEISRTIWQPPKI